MTSASPLPALLPAGAPPRHTSEPLPPYAYLPGRSPHPHRSAEGHSRGQPPLRAEALPPERWREDRAWLLGVDLWNAGYFWEAHEAWESAWHARGRRGEQAGFLQALIQAAAAHVKACIGEPAGVEALWGRADAALAPLERVRGAYMGLALREFRSRQRCWLAWCCGDREEAEPGFPFLRLDDDSPGR